MTTVHIEPITHEHEALQGPVDELVTIARELPALSIQERQRRADRVVTFMEEVLLPHARAEEHGLYQQVGRVLGHPEATAPMVYDHLAVREWTARLAATDPAEVEQLQQLLYGLHALIVEHFRKEEELYEPLLRRVEEESGRQAYDAPALVHEP